MLCISNDEESVPPALVACARGNALSSLKSHFGFRLVSGAVIFWKSGYHVSGTLAPVMTLGLPSRLIIITTLAWTSGCFFSHACEPTRPFSSAANRIITIERLGFAPAALIRRTASMPGANPEPSSTVSYTHLRAHE